MKANAEVLLEYMGAKTTRGVRKILRAWRQICVDIHLERAAAQTTIACLMRCYLAKKAKLRRIAEREKHQRLLGVGLTNNRKVNGCVEE